MTPRGFLELQLSITHMKKKSRYELTVTKNFASSDGVSEHQNVR